jgi:predicted O-methyltransferase YrrM
MVRALQPELVVETGSWIGTTAAAIGNALRSNGHGRMVTLEIDPHLAKRTRDRVGGLPVTVLNQSSLGWTPDAPIDFAWFDSDAHRRHDEFLAYLPWMHARTVVGFHDTGPQHPVRPFLDRLVADGVLEAPLYLPTPRGVCFARPITNGDRA